MSFQLVLFIISLEEECEAHFSLNDICASDSGLLLLIPLAQKAVAEWKCGQCKLTIDLTVSDTLSSGQSYKGHYDHKLKL